jgi:hypothetical protein
MVKLFFTIFFLISIKIYSQGIYDRKYFIGVNGNIDISSVQKLFEESGINYLGDGMYISVKFIGCSNYRDLSIRRAFEQFEEWAWGQNINYNRISETREIVYSGNRCFDKGIVIYLVKDRYGNIIYTKDDAIYHLKEIKELYDLGIINKLEYDNKSKKWKEIYLSFE